VAQAKEAPEHLPLVEGEARAARVFGTVAPRTSILIPAYNEEAGLGVVLDRLFTVIDDSCEVIVIDDGSTDATGAVAARYPCRLLQHKVNLGKGHAVRAGLAVAQGELVVMVDADNSYPAEEVPRLIDKLKSHDLISGSRIGKASIPPMNRVGNWMLRTAIRRLYGSTVIDPLTGLYASRADVLRRMQLCSDGFGLESEIVIKAARMGLRVHNHAITYCTRRGKSKLNPVKDGYRILRTILAHLALYNPTVTFIAPGLTFLALGVALMLLLILHPLRVGTVEFSFDTMIVAATVALLGSQVTVFGLATNLYACRHWMTTRDAVTNLLLHRRARDWLLWLGLGLVLAGIIWGLWLFTGWIRGGAREFTQTGEAVFVSFLIVIGIQTLFSLAFLALFMSAFRES
jgi:glycosyltransferase involved in cell wall biosynthesis